MCIGENSLKVKKPLQKILRGDRCAQKIIVPHRLVLFRKAMCIEAEKDQATNHIKELLNPNLPLLPNLQSVLGVGMFRGTLSEKILLKKELKLQVKNSIHVSFPLVEKGNSVLAAPCQGVVINLGRDRVNLSLD